MEPFDIVVLSSGGSKGFAQLGALTRLTLGEYLIHVKRYIGVSIGSVLALLILCGYTMLDIYQLDLEQFINRWFADTRTNGFQMGHQGLLGTGSMKAFLSHLVQAKTGMSDPSFSDFRMPLTTVSCMLPRGEGTVSKIVYHSLETTPTRSVIDAVIASCCIPFVMERCVLDGETHVDGGLGNATPIEYASSFLGRVLCIYVESKCDTSTTSGYFMACMDIAKRADYERQKSQCNSSRVSVVEIVCHDINPMNYQRDKQGLFLLGWKMADNLIEQQHN
jgi:predicted acylesterase/phospholipase RssA